MGMVGSNRQYRQWDSAERWGAALPMSLHPAPFVGSGRGGDVVDSDVAEHDRDLGLELTALMSIAAANSATPIFHMTSRIRRGGT